MGRLLFVADDEVVGVFQFRFHKEDRVVVVAVVYGEDGVVYGAVPFGPPGGDGFFLGFRCMGGYGEEGHQQGADQDWVCACCLHHVFHLVLTMYPYAVQGT